MVNANDIDDRKEVESLFKQLQKNLPALEELLSRSNDHWGYEDPIYRFYHQSFKVYDLQRQTLEIVEKLREIAPTPALNEWFEQIVNQGTGKSFVPQHNRDWLTVTRPILGILSRALFSGDGGQVCQRA